MVMDRTLRRETGASGLHCVTTRKIQNPEKPFQVNHSLRGGQVCHQCRLKKNEKNTRHDPATPNAPGKRKKNQIMGIALRAIATRLRASLEARRATGFFYIFFIY